jgi:hypothetical protein
MTKQKLVPKEHDIKLIQATNYSSLSASDGKSLYLLIFWHPRISNLFLRKQGKELNKQLISFQP